MSQLKLNRIWHNYTLWEDARNNMYGVISKEKREGSIQKVINHFRSGEYKKHMQKVVKEWKYACEHNLSNTSMNRVAWLGQASVSIRYKIPEDITRIAWGFLFEHEKEKANNTAKEIIKGWEKCQKNI